jgi:uncharacterized membrane protein
VGKKKWPSFRPQSQRPVHQSMPQQPQAAQQIAIQGQFYAGPLPPAQELAAYDQISAGFANRILTMAEKEQDHRHEIGRRQNRAQVWLSSAGQIFGFILSLAIVSGGVWLLAHDKPLIGFVSLLVGIGTVAAPFFYQARNQRTSQS